MNNYGMILKATIRKSIQNFNITLYMSIVIPHLTYLFDVLRNNALIVTTIFYDRTTSESNNMGDREIPKHLEKIDFVVSEDNCRRKEVSVECTRSFP